MNTISVSDLITMLRERYSPPIIPPCSVCGEELTVVAAGGPHGIVYACSITMEDPDNQGKFMVKSGRHFRDEHYERSRRQYYGKFGDADVIKLLDIIERLEMVGEKKLEGLHGK